MLLNGNNKYVAKILVFLKNYLSQYIGLARTSNNGDNIVVPIVKLVALMFVEYGTILWGISVDFSNWNSW